MIVAKPLEELKGSQVGTTAPSTSFSLKMASGASTSCKTSFTSCAAETDTMCSMSMRQRASKLPWPIMRR